MTIDPNNSNSPELVDPLDGKSKRTAKTDDPGTGMVSGMANIEARNVIGVFDERAQAETAHQALLAAGFSDNNISVAFQPVGTAPELSANDTHARESTTTGATAGAIVGGALGLVALAIPGVGPLLAAGPLLAVLSGVAAGGALGGLIGSFAGLGVPTERATMYEEAIRAGGVVVAVKVEDKAQTERAEQIMRQEQARDVSSYQEAL